MNKIQILKLLQNIHVHVEYLDELPDLEMVCSFVPVFENFFLMNKTLFVFEGKSCEGHDGCRKIRSEKNIHIVLASTCFNKNKIIIYMVDVVYWS